MSPRTVAIIQARMASSRLPGKVLLDIAGEPMLARVYQRTSMAKSLDEVLVATTTREDDDAVAAFCQQRDYRHTRGSLHDVLDRYYQAARQAQADTVVRVTADCPLLDPTLLDETVQACQGNLSGMNGQPFDFAANRLPPPWGRSYPIGLDVEVCSINVLEQAWRQADQPFQREHVMPYLYEAVQFSGPPETYQELGEFRRSWIAGRSLRGYSIVQIHHAPDYGAQRWTVDTPEDLELLRQICARLPDDQHFTWLDVLALLQREPNLTRINAQIRHKDYRAVDERLDAGKTDNPK